MGKSLVITVQSGSENIARIYYHWSAYTRSALEEARDIIEYLDDIDPKTVPQIQLALIRLCEKNGGGIDGGLESTEGVYIQEQWPHEQFRKAKPDRRYGLIAITETRMDKMLGWADGDLTIDVEDRMIYNGVFYLSDFDSWKECYGEIYGKTQEELGRMTLDDIPELHHDIEDIRFCEIDDLINELSDRSSHTFRRGNIVYDLME